MRSAELPPAVEGEYFPGFADTRRLPYLYAASAELTPMSPADRQLGWYLDFHYPAGVHPLSHVLLGAVFRGAQQAADALPAGPTHGLAGRTVGPHVYSAALDVLDPHERADRAARSAAELAAYPGLFAERWATQARELDRRFGAVVAAARHRAGPRELDEAVDLFASGWRIHFEVMYRLLAVDASFEALCRALEISEAESADLRVAGASSMRAADQALAGLAAAARADGLGEVFAGHEGAQLLAALHDSEPARSWLDRFAGVLERHGDRTDVVADVEQPSWREDPLRPLDIVRRWTLGPPLVPDGSARTRARHQVAERARSRLSAADRRVFDAGLGVVDSANFSWWNEEHNAHIDLRLHLALRAVARAVVADRGGVVDDVPYLFAEEVRALATDDLRWADVADLAVQRRRWRDAWQARRASLPRTVGVAAPPLDPVMAHVIGGPSGAPTPPEAVVLSGLAASPGRYRGPVRVVRTPDALASLRPGEVLVCEATSPSWTPAFVTAAACVCDSGGVLTHAAIICREYGLPCVCAVGVATRALRDGDLVEVDGTAGTVTRLGRPS